jgi:ammonia channel protein AmtB
VVHAACHDFHPVTTEVSPTRATAIARLFIYSHGSTSISFVSYQHSLTYAQPPAFYDRRSLYDFAGSGVVHMTGGTAALVGAWVVGQRDPRQFRRDSVVPFDKTNDKAETVGHSMPLVALGTLIMVFGFIGKSTLHSHTIALHTGLLCDAFMCSTECVHSTPRIIGHVELRNATLVAGQA